MKLFTLFVIAISGYFVDASGDGQIVKLKQVPYMAALHSIFEGDGEDWCGATILSEHWILTAAHCTQRKGLLFRQVRVKAYTTLREGQFYNISRVIEHKDYTTRTSDISLILLETPIKFDENSQPIAISNETPKAGQVISISKYGYDNSEHEEVLWLDQQTVISPEACKKAYKKASHPSITIDNRVFCTNPEPSDYCVGYFGGPAVMYANLVGIAVEGCRYPPLPHVYVNIAHYYDWISYFTRL